MNDEIQLRDVTEQDVSVFFEHQLDPAANYVAAFTARDPEDRDAFAARWARILADPTIARKTVLFNGQVAGSVLSFVAPWSGQREVSYWIGREYWGKGIATRALSAFVDQLKDRPLYARAARDNAGSIRVLEKCGFILVGCERGFANARGEEIEEAILELSAHGNAQTVR